MSLYYQAKKHIFSLKIPILHLKIRLQISDGIKMINNKYGIQLKFSNIIKLIVYQYPQKRSEAFKDFASTGERVFPQSEHCLLQQGHFWYNGFQHACLYLSGMPDNNDCKSSHHVFL